jgi:hypothetical protein
VWDATVLCQHAPRRQHVAAQLHRLGVSVTRLPGGPDTGATLRAVSRIRINPDPLNPDPDPAFQMNPDLDTDPGF